MPRSLAWLPFVASAALVALAIHLGLRSPWVALFLGGVALLLLGSRLKTRDRMRSLLQSGDVHRVLDVWEPMLSQMPDASTMGPLIRATAFAAYGWTDHSRRSLDRARHGPAWDQALEHRLLVETLLHCFEGERELALEKAERLNGLPLTGSPWARARAATLRTATAALARAFAHKARSGDLRRLSAAARQNPLLHWATRYGQAIIQIDRGRFEQAETLIRDAPRWPQDSAFAAFHNELSTLLEKRAQHA